MPPHAAQPDSGISVVLFWFILDIFHESFYVFSCIISGIFHVISGCHFGFFFNVGLEKLASWHLSDSTEKLCTHQTAMLLRYLFSLTGVPPHSAEPDSGSCCLHMLVYLVMYLEI